VKKVFNKILSGNHAPTVGTHATELIDVWRPDEDIFIVGVEMFTRMSLFDENDSTIEWHVELNQAGDTGREPTVGIVTGTYAWNTTPAAVDVAGSGATEVIMFPEGYGFRVTEDSALNLWVASKHIAGVDSTLIACYAIIWFVPARNVK